MVIDELQVGATVGNYCGVYPRYGLRGIDDTINVN